MITGDICFLSFRGKVSSKPFIHSEYVLCQKKNWCGYIFKENIYGGWGMRDEDAVFQFVENEFCHAADDVI